MNAPFLLRCKRCLGLVDPAERWQVRAHIADCGHRDFKPVAVDANGRALEDDEDGPMFHGGSQHIERPGKP